jgi:hypothetical protein
VIDATPSTTEQRNASQTGTKRHGGGSRSTAHRPRPTRPLRRRLRWPIVTSVIVQAILVMGDRMPSVDAMSYFETGRNVIDGNGYTRSGSPELHFPPIAPVTLGVLEHLTGSDMSALRIWNLAWGVCAVLLLTALGWFLSRDDDVTVATAWFATAVPGVVTLAIKGGSGSELATVCFILGAALVTLRSLEPERDLATWKRTAGVAGAGFLVGMAYLTRPESLMPGLIIGASAALVALRDRSHPLRQRLATTVRYAAAFGLAALVFIVPYVNYTHTHTGSWSLTSKTQDASIDAWRAVAQDNRLERDQILYAIQPDGVSLGPETESLVAIAAEHPRNWLTIAWINTTTIVKEYLSIDLKWSDGWGLIPVFLLIPALWQMWRTRRQRSTLLLAAVGAFPLVTCFLFFVLPRYLILTTAVLIPFGAWGLVEFLRSRQPGTQRLAWWGVGGLSLVAFAIGAWSLLPYSTTPERTEQRTVGLWLKENTPDDARVMTRSFHVQGYSERDVVAFPYALYPDMLTFARRMGVDYIVADELTMRRRRPELFDTLMRKEGAPEGLELIYEFTEKGQTVKVYKLDPPAPITNQPPLPLGYVSD